MPNPQVNVCSSSWHGNAGETFDFTNANSSDCTVTSTGTWPFQESSPITVPARQTGGGPGSITCHLQSNLANGTYAYSVDGCPQLTGGLPKEVIIP